MNVQKVFKLSMFLMVFAAGCSALPGLRVIAGDDEQDDTLAAQAIENINLVMADKTGLTDPSIIIAADRIESALPGFDIIEIRNDEIERDFEVNIMVAPDTTLSIENLRRMNELTWQGTIRESEGSDMLRINVLSPIEVNTLDRGTSVIGQVIVNFEIARSDAVVYLSDRHDFNDFVGLILDGTITFDQPAFQLYAGSPNHPMFILPDNAPNLSNLVGSGA